MQQSGDAGGYGCLRRDDWLTDITVGTAGMRYGYDNNGNRKGAYDKATTVNTSFS